MIVEKVLNNNVVVSIEPKTRKEIILMGQGIAFGKKIGQEIDESKIEKRFMVEDKTLGDKIKKLKSFFNFTFVNFLPYFFMHLKN